jgi:hypothetical protein
MRASDIKIRFKSFLPGAGRDSAGDSVQGKTRVVGEVDVTSYTVGGEALSAIDLGLSTVDAISLRVKDETGSTSGDRRREALYSASTGQFYLNNITTAGVSAQYADAATESVQFDVFGDSASDVELT